MKLVSQKGTFLDLLGGFEQVPGIKDRTLHEMQLHVKIFYAQRNMYLTGATFFLSLYIVIIYFDI